MIFGVLNPEKFDTNSLYIFPSYLYTVATLPWDIDLSPFSPFPFLSSFPLPAPLTFP